MKIIKFDLPLNEKKIRSLEELRENATVELLSHLKSGLLKKWLRSRELLDDALKIEAIAIDDDKEAFCQLCSVFGIEMDQDIAAAMIEQAKEGLSERIFDDLAEAVFKVTTRALLTRVVYSLDGGTYECSGKVEYSRVNKGSYDRNAVFDLGERIATCSNGNTVEANQRMKIVAISRSLSVESGEVVFVLEEIEGILSKTPGSALVLLRSLCRAFTLEINACSSDTGKAVLNRCRTYIEEAIEIVAASDWKVNFTMPGTEDHDESKFRGYDFETTSVNPLWSWLKK